MLSRISRGPLATSLLTTIAGAAVAATVAATVAVSPAPAGTAGSGSGTAVTAVASPAVRINVRPTSAELPAPDPLDGPVAPGRNGAADDSPSPLPRGAEDAGYAIEASSAKAGNPELAHDGEPGSAWAADGPRVTAEFDLGEVRPIEEVRWLPAGTGPVVIQRSLLGGVWVTVERVDAPEPGVWQTASVDWPARYLRFRFAGGEGGDRLAEVEVVGPAGEEARRRDRDRVSAEQRVDRDRGRDNERARERDRKRSERAAAAQERQQAAAERTTRRGAGDEQGGNTDGSRRQGGGGDRVVDGRSSVVEDCGDGSGECRIEIDVSAGSATCDESGGSGNRAVGRNASAGEGGTCVRDASGGSVELGDINP